MAAGKVGGPFAVINSDDFYGRKAYKAIADHYKGWKNTKKNDYCMVGYRLSNTVSDFGFVSRGICKTDKESNLIDVVERIHIEKLKNGIAYKEGDQFFPLADDSVVSMNFWGFTPSFFDFLQHGFTEFLSQNLENPRAEFYIPSVVNHVIKAGAGSVKVLNSHERWFGMTYKEDREIVVKGIRALIEKGIYPEKLWG